MLWILLMLWMLVVTSDTVLLILKHRAASINSIA